MAKEEFEKIAGQIYESDHSYEDRIKAFHNWYVLDRPLDIKGLTPLAYYLEYNANSLTQETLNGLKELEDNIHSVFEVLSKSRSGVKLRNLVDGIKYTAEDSDALAVVDKNAVFNSRIFHHGKKAYLSNYLIVHPDVVENIIRTEAKQVRKGKHEAKPFLFRLLFFHSRFEQYKQMEPKNIYRFD